MCTISDCPIPNPAPIRLCTLEKREFKTFYYYICPKQSTRATASSQREQQRHFLNVGPPRPSEKLGPLKTQLRTRVWIRSQHYLANLQHKRPS